MTPRGHSVEPGDMRAAWDQLSPIYQAHHEFSTANVHYGPWAPLERDLQLLGDVGGRRVLELGCGGGQCCIAFARQGATVTGVDFSAAQIAYARQLATQEHMSVQFIQGAAEDLSVLAAGAYDLVFTVNTLTYIADAAACLAECYRVLVPGGRLVLALDHPLRHCFLDPGLTGIDDDWSIVPVRRYYDEGWHRWRWPGSHVVLQSYHRTIGQWTDLLVGAGMQLIRIVEPLPPADLLDDILPEDGALAPLRLVPHVAIFMAQKG
ncbi:MAG: class I SAM-dependent methyltransferase [Caldilineaceae bacterium]